jgi:acyl-CoA thioesterase YciA
MPADANQYGDIFGGWLLGQMDIVGGIFASKAAGGRCATVAIAAMAFKKHVSVGDVMCIYADLIQMGQPPSRSMSRPGCCAAITRPSFW